MSLRNRPVKFQLMLLRLLPPLVRVLAPSPVSKVQVGPAWRAGEFSLVVAADVPHGDLAAAGCVDAVRGGYDPAIPDQGSQASVLVAPAVGCDEHQVRRSAGGDSGPPVGIPRVERVIGCFGLELR